MAILTALQAALASAMLAPLLGSGRSGAARSSGWIEAAGWLPLPLALLVIWLLLRLPQAAAFVQEAAVVEHQIDGRFIWLPVAMGFYGLQNGIFLRLRPRAPLSDGSWRGGVFNAGWFACAFFSQFVFTRCALALLARWFHGKYAAGGMDQIVSVQRIELMLVAAVCSAAWLIAWLTAGALCLPATDDEVPVSAAAGPAPSSGAASVAGPLRLIAIISIMAVLLRLAAIAASLALAVSAHPFGPGHFLTISLAPGSTMLLVRLMLGLGLPLLYALLALEALRNRMPRQAAFQFLPALLMVLMSELLAAGLTAGMWGIAF